MSTFYVLLSYIEINGNAKHDSLDIKYQYLISVYMISHLFKPMFYHASSTVMMVIIFVSI